MKTPKLVVEDLDTMLKHSGKPFMTMTWPEFYKLSERNRIKSSFRDEVKRLASGQFQLNIAFGVNSVIVCHDRNFSPMIEEIK